MASTGSMKKEGAVATGENRTNLPKTDRPSADRGEDRRPDRENRPKSVVQKKVVKKKRLVRKKPIEAESPEDSEFKFAGKKKKKSAPLNGERIKRERGHSARKKRGSFRRRALRQNLITAAICLAVVGGAAFMVYKTYKRSKAGDPTEVEEAAGRQGIIESIHENERERKILGQFNQR